MLEKIPTSSELENLLGAEIYTVWRSIADFIAQNYNMEILWDIGRKAGIYECKFRKSNKTLCCLYTREKSFGFMIIFGKAEREKFESNRLLFSKAIQDVYDDTHQYHDGKWIMIDMTDGQHLDDIKMLITTKKKPKI